MNAETLVEIAELFEKVQKVLQDYEKRLTWLEERYESKSTSDIQN